MLALDPLLLVLGIDRVKVFVLYHWGSFVFFNFKPRDLAVVDRALIAANVNELVSIGLDEMSALSDKDFDPDETLLHLSDVQVDSSRGFGSCDLLFKRKEFLENLLV